MQTCLSHYTNIFSPSVLQRLYSARHTWGPLSRAARGALLCVVQAAGTKEGSGCRWHLLTSVGFVNFAHKVHQSAHIFPHYSSLGVLAAAELRLRVGWRVAAFHRFRLAALYVDSRFIHEE